MNIEDCEVGMEIKDGEDNEYIIREVGSNKIKLKGFICSYPSKFFEPVNKFKVGDEVIYNCPNGIKYESIIFGIKDRQYAIKYTHKRIEHYDVVKERQLSPLKKPDELEVGDKFKDVFGFTNKILYKTKDKREGGAEQGHIVYFSRVIKGPKKGATTTNFDTTVDKIIYD